MIYEIGENKTRKNYNINLTIKGCLMTKMLYFCLSLTDIVYLAVFSAKTGIKDKFPAKIVYKIVEFISF